MNYLWQLAVVVLGLVSTLPSGQSWTVAQLAYDGRGDPEELAIAQSQYKSVLKNVPSYSRSSEYDSEDLEVEASDQEYFYDEADDDDGSADGSQRIARSVNPRGETTDIDEEDFDLDNDLGSAASEVSSSTFGLSEFMSEDGSADFEKDLTTAATGYGHDDFSHHDDHSYNDKHGFKKNGGGSHHKDFDKGFHSNLDKDYGGHQNGDKHYGSKKLSKGGNRGNKHGSRGHRNKKHRTKGFKNVYHKEEFGKKQKFLDDSNLKKFHNKHSNDHKNFNNKHGNRNSGKNFHGGRHSNKHGNAGHHKHGSFHNDKHGNKKQYGGHGSHGSHGSHDSDHDDHFGGYGDYSHESPSIVSVSDASSESYSI